MENLFQTPYDTIFKNWYRLRESLEQADTKTKCIEVDKWWQRAPLVNHYLHSDFVKDWPDPWELISDNHYCHLARGLGTVYTLYLLGVRDIDFVEAKDYNNEDVALVIVEKKFILNYWPNTVETNKLSDFTSVNNISMSLIIQKI